MLVVLICKSRFHLSSYLMTIGIPSLYAREIMVVSALQILMTDKLGFDLIIARA